MFIIGLVIIVFLTVIVAELSIMFIALMIRRIKKRQKKW
jgi:hypothetical protein